MSSIGSSSTDAQLWNQYSYCRGNPIGYVDISGCFTLIFQVDILRVEYGAPIPSKDQFMWRGPGFTHRKSYRVEPIEDSLKFTAEYVVYLWDDKAMEGYNKDYDKTKAHEVSGHCLFVYAWVNSRCDNIENKWKKERLKDEQKALTNAEKDLEDARFWGIAQHLAV
jgi:hypothetical protein